MCKQFRLLRASQWQIKNDPEAGLFQILYPDGHFVEEGGKRGWVLLSWMRGIFWSLIIRFFAKESQNANYYIRWVGYREAQVGMDSMTTTHPTIAFSDIFWIFICWEAFFQGTKMRNSGGTTWLQNRPCTLWTIFVTIYKINLWGCWNPF